MLARWRHFNLGASLFEYDTNRRALPVLSYDRLQKNVKIVWAMLMDYRISILDVVCYKAIRLNRWAERSRRSRSLEMLNRLILQCWTVLQHFHDLVVTFCCLWLVHYWILVNITWPRSNQSPTQLASWSYYIILMMALFLRRRLWSLCCCNLSLGVQFQVACILLNNFSVFVKWCDYVCRIKNDWTFDEAMANYGCEVHSFDPRSVVNGVLPLCWKIFCYLI